MKPRTFLAIVLLGSFLFPLQILSQSPIPQTSKPATEPPAIDDQDVIRINTNLVQIDAVVTRNGKQVTDLQAEDFVILQDGKPQVITNFSYVSNVAAGTSIAAAAPAKATDKPSSVPPAAVHPHDTRRTMAFVVDDLGMTFETIDRARRQLRKFINEQMAPTDLIAIIRTGGAVGALQQFTTDKLMLLNAVDHIKWNPCSRVGINLFEPPKNTCSSMNQGDTLTSLRFVVNGMSSLPGRKSLVLLSDSMPVQTEDPGPAAPPGRQGLNGASAQPVVASGGDETNNVEHSYVAALHKIAEAAIRGSVVIYAVDTRGVVDTFPSAAVSFGSARGYRQVGPAISAMSKQLFDDRQGSGIIAKETGGLLFYNTNDLEIKRVVEDQQGYYLIGFRPTGETFNDKFHHISIKVKPKGLAVRTRAGFYGITDDAMRKAQQAELKSVNAILSSPFGINDITVRLTTVFANTGGADSLLRSFIYVNARDISFSAGTGGSHLAAFDVDSILFGDNGQPVYQRSQTASLQMNEEQYQRALRDGVTYDFDVPVKKPGGFQFRVAVRDHDSAKIGTAAQFIQVPDLSTNVLTLSGIVLTDEAGSSSAGGFTPGSRTFRRGASLVFGYAIYNAQPDKSRQEPQLTSQTRIFRDGKLIYTGEPAPLSLTGQSDLQRITAGGRLQLGADFPTGEYVLQIVVIERTNKDKPRTATQWIDFEVK